MEFGDALNVIIHLTWLIILSENIHSPTGKSKPVNFYKFAFLPASYMLGQILQHFIFLERIFHNNFRFLFYFVFIFKVFTNLPFRQYFTTLHASLVMISIRNIWDLVDLVRQAVRYHDHLAIFRFWLPRHDFVENTLPSRPVTIECGTKRNKKTIFIIHSESFSFFGVTVIGILL